MLAVFRKACVSVGDDYNVISFFAAPSSAAWRRLAPSFGKKLIQKTPNSLLSATTNCRLQPSSAQRRWMSSPWRSFALLLRMLHIARRKDNRRRNTTITKLHRSRHDTVGITSQASYRHVPLKFLGFFPRGSIESTNAQVYNWQGWYSNHMEMLLTCRYAPRLLPAKQEEFSHWTAWHMRSAVEKSSAAPRARVF